MVSDVTYGEPGFGIGVEDSSNHVFALAREELWESILSSHDFLVKVRCLWILERQISANHGVENYSTAPNVCSQSMVPLSGDHLWSCVTWRSACCLESSSRLIHVTETEINNFESEIVVQ